MILKLNILFVGLFVILLSFTQNSQGSEKKSFKKIEQAKKKGLTDRSVAYKLYKGRFFLSSLKYLKKHYKKHPERNKDMEKLMEVLLVKAGTVSLGDMPSSLLKKIKSPTVSLILGRRYFYKNKFRTSIKYLDEVPDEHRLSPDVYILKGTILNKQGKKDEADVAFGKCVDVTLSLKDKAKQDKLKRYYDVLTENCYINKARIAFERKEFKKSIEYFEKVPKVSYYWPYIILEMAWAHYYLEDYNRVLGLLVTYKSPLLSSYFFPEAEMLKALAYYRLCLWDDALNVIERFYQIYRPKSDQLHSMLTKYKDSHSFFYKFVHTPIDKNEKKNMFIRNLITMVKKKIKYQLDRNSYNYSKEEFLKLRSMPKGDLQNELIYQVRDEALYRKAKINHFTKKIFFNFLNDVYKHGQNLFSLKMQILSSKRHMLYANKELVVNGKRGSLSEVNRKSNQYVWTFRGEFWADELGDYSFGLSSQCTQQTK